MTEKQTIEVLEMNRPFAYSELQKAIDVAIHALTEIQEYRAIGTVEDIREIYSLCKILQNVVKDYSAIGTIEEFKALKEKSVAKKPKIWANGTKHCPNEDCEEVVFSSDEYCLKCGTRLDWQ